MKSSLKKHKISIDKLIFDQPGKISIKMEDGRLFTTPLKYFPEIKKLSKEKRKKYTIVDERSIFFAHADTIYHLEDFIGLEEKWRER